MKLKFSLFLFFFALLQITYSQEFTKIYGTVKDKKTGEGLPFVNIIFKGKYQGTTTDFEGKYEISTSWPSNSLIVSFLGYQQVEKALEIGKEQRIDFELESTVQELEEIEISAKKNRYRKKNNPAVDLIRNIIKNKSFHKKEVFDYFEYEKYEKEQYDLNNFGKKWQKSKALKNFQIIFNYVDTSELNDKPFIPILMKETFSTIYIKNNPKIKREIIDGSLISGFEESIFSEGISQFLEKLSAEVNIYENNIFLLDKTFTSPISIIAPEIYRFYITDSMIIDGYRYKELSFQPRNPASVAFKGKMIVADSTQFYGIKSIKLTVDKRININFLNNLEIIQKFENKDSLGWVIVKDKIIVDVQPTEKGFGIYNTKTTIYKNFKINIKRNDELYSGLNKLIYTDSSSIRKEDYWEKKRPEHLSKNEKGIYEMADSIKHIPAFERITNLLELLVSGYTKFHGIDIGPVLSFASYNQIEGFRVRFGFRTNSEFNEKWRFTTYGAYGFKDEKWKYRSKIDYFFNKRLFRKVTLDYRKELYQPGFNLNWQDQDNVFLSFRRNGFNKTLYSTKINLELNYEWILGFSNSLNFETKTLETTTLFKIEKNSGEIVKNIKLNSITFGTRFSINEKFVNGKFSRASIKTEAPIFYLNYTLSLHEWGSDFAFQKIYFAVDKRFKLSLLGHVDVLFENTLIIGDVPFLFLDIPRGNQTFSYDDKAFNLMNFLEFGSDRSSSLQGTHHFNGFLLNKVPLLKKLKWRSVSSFKIIYGDISKRNSNKLNPDLYKFPKDFYKLKAIPYIEWSTGIENIFKFLRFDIVKRLTYLNHTGVNKLFGVKGWGIRAKAEITF